MKGGKFHDYYPSGLFAIIGKLSATVMAEQESPPLPRRFEGRRRRNSQRCTTISPHFMLRRIALWSRVVHDMGGMNLVAPRSVGGERVYESTVR